MPKRRFGQHFLTDRRILGRIVEFSRVASGDTVVEIGPGRGTLTRTLAASVARVVAVEIDRDLVGALSGTMPANVEVLAGDALEVDFRTIGPAGYHIVANLPYNVATPLIGRFVNARSAIGSATVLVQKEVGERIVAVPGTGDYGPLTIGVQYFADVERGFVLKPGSFTPPPKVESRVIRLSWKRGVGDNPGFFSFVRGAFAARRKTLANNLAAVFPFYDRADIVGAIATMRYPASVRAECLPIPDLERLYRDLTKPGRL